MHSIIHRQRHLPTSWASGERCCCESSPAATVLFADGEGTMLHIVSNLVPDAQEELGSPPKGSVKSELVRGCGGRSEKSS